jgi:hypothetical protein
MEIEHKKNQSIVKSDLFGLTDNIRLATDRNLVARVN